MKSLFSRLTASFHVGWVVSAGFGFVILLLLLSVTIGLYLFSFHYHQLAGASEDSTRKIYLAYKMRDAIRDRIDTLYTMVNIDDPFERDERRMQFYALASNYSEARAELIKILQYPEERDFVPQLDRLARKIGGRNRQAMDMLQQLAPPDRSALLAAVEASIKGHQDLLRGLNAMVDLQRSVSRRVMAAAERDFTESLVIGIIVGVLAILIAVGTASVVIQRATEKNRQLSHQATHDQLTGLSNRIAFEQALNWALRESREDNSPHVLLFLDLDQFKIVNDTKGHQAGDLLLQEVALLLQSHLRASDLLARLGGDEFGVLLRYTPAAAGEPVADKLRKAIEDYRFDYEQDQFNIGVSIGMTPFQGDQYTLEKLLSTADSSCYAAKDGGRNRVHRSDVHDQELTQRSGEMRWAARLGSAIKHDQFVLHGQVMRPLSERAIKGRIPVELLIRLPDQESLGLIPPGQFLPAAERYGKMTEIDRWVVLNGIGWISSLGQLQSGLFASINICGQSASDPEFADFLYRTVIDSGVDPEALCFEITESVTVHNTGAAGRLIAKLGGLGCQFALDDFGSGVSSFGHLRHLDVDYLKIDGSYIRNITRNSTDRALVESINDIGHTLGKLTVAEYAEDEELIGLLQRMGLDYAQGFEVHRPSPLDQVESLLRSLLEHTDQAVSA